MAFFEDVMNNAKGLYDRELVELRVAIDRELQRREKDRELEAAVKVTKAIQDYLAAGYTLWVRGSAICDDHGFSCDKDIESEVFGVTNNDGEVTISMMECDLE